MESTTVSKKKVLNERRIVDEILITKRTIKEKKFQIGTFSKKKRITEDFCEKGKLVTLRNYRTKICSEDIFLSKKTIEVEEFEGGILRTKKVVKEKILKGKQLTRKRRFEEKSISINTYQKRELYWEENFQDGKTSIRTKDEETITNTEN